MALFIAIGIIILKFKGCIKPPDKKRKILCVIYGIWQWLSKMLVWNTLYILMLYYFIGSNIYGFISIIYHPLNSSAGKFNFIIGFLFLILNYGIIIHIILVTSTARRLIKEIKEYENNDEKNILKVPE